MRNNLFLGVAVAALVMPCAAMAQETTSTIHGNVRAGGNAVAGAEVTVTDTSTGAASKAVSDAEGGFTVGGLRPGGPYTIDVRATGFQPAQVTEINTVAAQTFELPVDLVVAGAGDTASAEVVVTASSRIPNARNISQGPATVLTAAKIAEIVSVNRDIRDLSRRDPFARLDDTPSGGRAISFAGQNPRYNKFSVDGVAITDSFGLNTDGLPSRRSPIPYDAIGQFQAQVAPYDVRQGNFQGGAVNIVLRSGTNKFQGTGFYAYSSDELNGKRTKPGPLLPDGRITLPNYKYENYGVELSGPIIKDKLFFMIAGERLRASLPIAEGPTDNNAGTPIPTLTQAQVDNVTAIAKSKYNYDTGGVIKTNGDKDDRLVAKLDANLSDTQRASLTYTYAKDAINLVQNAFTNAPYGLGLTSNAYTQGNRLHTGVFQLNSQWSDSFSTEARAFYKDYLRIQDPVLGRGFAQFQVCTAPTSDRTSATSTASINCPATNAVVSFGPDVSRQTNALRVKSYGGLIQTRLTMEDLDLRIFAEFSQTKTFNSFLQRSAGDYYFDSIADFQAGNAQRLRYQNDVLTLNPDDAAASFKYQSYAFGFQNNWRISDMFSVNYGLRYDLYGGHSRAVSNPNFLTRYGFPSNKYLSGLSVLQPRVGFTFKPTSEINVRGGVGVFSGGTPDVYVSNSFSNTGVLTNSIDIQQTSTTTYNNAAGAAILTNVNGTAIPTAANTALTSAALSGNAPTNALAKNFKLPSQWRSTLSADWTPSFLGGGWDFGGDVLYSRVRQQVDFRDIRIVPNGLTTPDGRTRYSPITGFTDNNSDLILTNSTKGRSYIAVARIRKTFDWGLDTGVSYTYSDIKDKNPATSSVASSNYAAGVGLDANGPGYGISNDQVKHNLKFDVSFNHAFFGDYKSTISLFGESRSGHPYSFTFRDPATRSALFGTIGSGSRYLLYVPTGVNDPKVSFDNANNAALFDSYINRSGLAKYRGKIAPRNVFTSKWVTKFDLHLAQEIPTGLGRSRLSAFLDIENFTNFLNRKWGQIREYQFPYAVAPVTVNCLTVAQPTGQGVVAVGTTAANNPNGLPTVQAANASQGCVQYRYAPNQTAVVNGVTQFTDPLDVIYPRQSLYTIRIGARFSF